MSCYFCPYNNMTQNRECSRCMAVLPGNGINERVTIVHADDNCKVASVVHEARVQKFRGKEEPDITMLSCMVVRIEFCGIKCLVVVSREDEEEQIRISAAQNIVSVNPKGIVKSTGLKLPL